MTASAALRHSTSSDSSLTMTTTRKHDVLPRPTNALRSASNGHTLAYTPYTHTPIDPRILCTQQSTTSNGNQPRMRSCQCKLCKYLLRGWCSCGVGRRLRMLAADPLILRDTLLECAAIIVRVYCCHKALTDLLHYGIMTFLL